MSQNFVRLNMKIRRYKRKGQSSTSKFKRHRCGKKDTCYKCGGKGHWARDCPASTNLGTFDGEEVLYCEEEEAGEGVESAMQEDNTGDVGEVGSTAVAKEDRVERRRAPVISGDTASTSVTVPAAKTRGKKSVKKAVSSSVPAERKRKRAVGVKKGKGKADRASEGSACDQPASADATWDLPVDSVGHGGGQLQRTDSVVMEDGELISNHCIVYELPSVTPLLSSSTW